MERVNSQLFFDITKFSRLAASPGPKQGHPATAQAVKQRKAGKGLFSELLVEKNVKCLKAKIEAPRC